MASSTFFQPCPTCGRHLQVRVRHLGKMVTCRHCGGEFRAEDPEHQDLGAPPRISLLQRADELLGQAESRYRL